MKSITKQENIIFDNWSNLIVKDGTVDEDSFLSTKIKILVIMKETNDYVNNEQDLRVFLKQGARGATWNNIVRWVYGLQNLDTDISKLWNNISYVNNNMRIKYLSTISSINLKKKPGGTTTNLDELKDESKKDIEYLKRQISLYQNLNFVLCGSRDVANLVDKYELFGTIEFAQHKNTYVQIAQANNTVIISYYHPQVRGKGSAKEELFKNLILSVKDYLHNRIEMFDCP